MLDQTKARILVNEFGEYSRELVRIYTPNYTFRWNANKRRFGVCRYREKSVELSMTNFLLNPHTGNDTIRHEIAHALAKEIGAKGHDYLWQQQAIKLGASPAACVDVEVQTKSKYELYCDRCGMSYPRHKKLSLGPGRYYLCKCRNKLIFRKRDNSNLNIIIPTIEELNLPAIQEYSSVS